MSAAIEILQVIFDLLWRVAAMGLAVFAWGFLWTSAYNRDEDDYYQARDAAKASLEPGAAQ